MLLQPLQVLLHEIGFVLVERAFDVVAVNALFGFLEQVRSVLDLLGPGHQFAPALFSYFVEILAFSHARPFQSRQMMPHRYRQQRGISSREATFGQKGEPIFRARWHFNQGHD